MLTRVNDHFDNTGFDNETYGMFVVNEQTPRVKHYYHPEAITGFKVQQHNYDTPNFDGTLHEMCHVIDINERKQFSRLLKPDYGIGTSLDGIDRIQVVLTELKVLTMQAFIGEALFGKVTDNYNIPETKAEFRRRWLDVTDEKWHAYTDSCMAQHRSNGIDYYRDQWNRACRYVAKHRQGLQ